MKNINLLPGLIALTLITGCTKQVSEKDGTAYLALNGRTVDITPTKASVALSQGTELGVYVPNVTSGTDETISTTSISNKAFTVGSDGSISGNTIYLSTGKDYDVYAYAPRSNGSIVDPSSISFTNGTDVICSATDQSLRSVSLGANTVNLNFTHKTSQIKFSISDDRDAATKIAFPFENATFQVTGFSGSYSLNLQTGILTPGPIDNTIKVTQQNTPVCFAPAASAMTLSVSVNIPGAATGEQVYSGAISNTFAAGNSYSYNIKITTTSLNITGSITDWVPVESGNIIVTPTN